MAVPNNVKTGVALTALMVLILGDIFLTGLSRDKPRQPVPSPNIHPQPIAPAMIYHQPGATNLAPGLNTNPANDPTPAAFQYGTGSDPFDGQTGEGSGPEGTSRTASIHQTLLQTAAAKQPQADAARMPATSLQAARTPAAQR